MHVWLKLGHRNERFDTIEWHLFRKSVLQYLIYGLFERRSKKREKFKIYTIDFAHDERWFNIGMVKFSYAYME